MGGTKIATEELKGRVLELNLADLHGDDDQAYKKAKLCIEDVQGRNCLTDFHGLTLTRDKLCSLIRKWHTLIEAHVDVKTSDGYMVRLFVIAFTKRRQDQEKTNCYAQTAQIRKIRRKMIDIIINEAAKVQLRELLKKPKFDITKLMELHGDGGGEDTGAAYGRPELEEAKNTLTADVEAAAED